MLTGKGKIRLLFYVAMVFLIMTAGIDEASPKARKKVKWVKSKYGLKALIQLSKDRGVMIRTFEKETENYQRTKESLAKGRIKKGDEASKVIKSCGEPVISFPADENDNEKWVYKPASASFFDKEKIYLFFDESGALAGWEMISG